MCRVEEVEEQHVRSAGRSIAFVALAAAGCLWGTGFLFGKLALAEMGVGHMVLYRFAFACIALVPIAVARRVRVRREDVPTFLLASVLGVPIQFLVQFEGLDRTTVSHASLMVGTLPMLLALSAVIFTRERLDRVGWLSLVASTAGAMLIALGAGATSGGHSGVPRVGPSLVGDALVLLSLVAAVGWILASKRLMQRYPPVIASAYVIVLGTVMLAIGVLARDGPPPVDISARAWLAVAAQGLLATALTTLLWNWGLARTPASVAGVYVNLEPVVGAILGVTILHEALGPHALLGGALIIGAAVVLTRREDR